MGTCPKSTLSDLLPRINLPALSFSRIRLRIHLVRSSQNQFREELLKNFRISRRYLGEVFRRWSMASSYKLGQRSLLGLIIPLIQPARVYLCQLMILSEGTSP